MQSLENRHALVTGGASGIGLATTEALVAAGARVTIASRNRERVSEIAGRLDNVTGASLDVSDPDSIAAVFAAAGHVDILVNNAGIAMAMPFEKTRLDDWHKIISVNLTSVLLCSQAVLPSMREKNSGRIINIASTAGLKGYQYIAAYAASKHGVVGLTRSLALELANTGITANCVCPGFTETDMAESAITNIMSKTGRTRDETVAELVAHNPQARMVTPAEVSGTVMWLCEDTSSSINGLSIAVAGGEIT